MKKQLVSIIIPVYNASKYLKETIATIEEQTYENWEAIFVDDCSNDNSKKIIENSIKKDKRIKLLTNNKNSGAAVTRNNGINYSNGEYICFLDADDKWDKRKLEKQIKFMNNLDCAFSYTAYQFCNVDCLPTGKKVSVPESITYKQALKNTTIWTSTVMFNMKKLTKEDIQMPNVKRGQDTATWWKVLRTKVSKAYGINEILSYYRRDVNTLSSNKLKALKRTWNLYRKVECLNIINSVYNFGWYCFNAVRRRI